ncbi:pirin family protein [Sediminibacterium sp.]|uniref:pirin family protein n=1 Tax=Sediminibacterium sp. TaxID=1917865 RepID=UPI0025D4D167|nr:pirin family protein [Sediminibacterium sp.]
MKTRTIDTIAYGQPMDMGGFPIRQALPSTKADMLDPFLLLHHANIKVPQHVDVKNAGVGPHPHRGFSPVTFIFKGGVHHRDSRGNSHIVYEGGTQWMNAGMGVIHSERPPANIHELGSTQELIQLWINTPAANKMDAPAYIPVTKEDTPVVRSADGLTSIQVVAGELNGVKGPITPQTSINMFTIHIKKGGTYFIPFASSHNAFIYALEGNIHINEQSALAAFYMASFNKDGEGVQITATEDSVLLMGTGEPLNEPVVSHGPFVMNNQTQLLEAFRDYQMGKMGVLIEE